MANTNSLSLVKASNQYASITDTAQTGLDITGDITFECWIKLSSVTSVGNGYVFVSKDDLGSQRSYQFALDRNGAIVCFFTGTGSPGGGYVVIQTPNGIITTSSVGQWIHIALSINTSIPNGSIYINSIPQTVLVLASSSTSIFSGSANFNIGWLQNATDSYFDGLIDEVRIWSVARTATQISNNYNKQLTGTETGLRGYWQLNNDYLDKTANGNTLTPFNAPVFSIDVPFSGVTTSTPTANAPFFGCVF